VFAGITQRGRNEVVVVTVVMVVIVLEVMVPALMVMVFGGRVV
jgi:hypothetical protein